MANKRTHKQNPTLNKILFGSIGSFLFVMLFPQGAKFFFRNMFAETVRTVVMVALTGLLTKKLADKLTHRAHDA